MYILVCIFGVKGYGKYVIFFFIPHPKQNAKVEKAVSSNAKKVKIMRVLCVVMFLNSATEKSMKKKATRHTCNEYVYTYIHATICCKQ